MKCMNSTFAHGNGPYMRTVDLGLAVNQELEARGHEQLPIIVPLVYGERQERIMFEDFGDIMQANYGMILFDEFHGKILEELFFKSGHYQENLEFLLENQPKLEERLRDYLSGELRLKDASGREVRVNGRDVQFEISHNPRVATGYENSFYTTIGFFSEILMKSIAEGRLDFDPELLCEVEGEIADKIEDDKSVHFMPEPFVFSYEKGRRRWRDEIFTPPFIHSPEPNNEGVPEGMYVMVTGIEGLRNLFDCVGGFGMQLYCPSFVKDLEGADRSHGPEFVANPNIQYQFGRTGWSTVWWSHMTETPLITPAYSEGDDPEIHFNERCVGALGIATVLDDSSDPSEVLKRADAQRPNLRVVNQKLVDRYGTLDGIDYTARAIVDVLEGKDIQSYRDVEPALS